MLNVIRVSSVFDDCDKRINEKETDERTSKSDSVVRKSEKVVF